LEQAIAEEEAEEPTVAEEEVAEARAPEPDEEVPSVAAEELEPAPITAEEELVPAAAIEEPPPEDLGQYISRQRSYAEEHPDDPEAWLELGRVLWQADKGEEAIQTYDHLIRRGELLDEIIPDLQDYAEQSSDPGVQQALGDAYARTDRLQDALDVYRRALAGL
ncbi:MAG: tetratricopeptide repeat protein, partial [Chloroflexota bacterium]